MLKYFIKTFIKLYSKTRLYRNCWDHKKFTVKAGLRYKRVLFASQNAKIAKNFLRYKRVYGISELRYKRVSL